MKTKLAAALVVALCASLITPVLAGAQQVSPTENQYDNELTQINQGTDPPATTPATSTPPVADTDSGLSARVGPLPFTGFDVIAMSAVALAVAGLGLALQRAVSRNPSDPVS